MPINVWVQMPSYVPLGAEAETPGASLGTGHAQAMTWPGIIS